MYHPYIGVKMGRLERLKNKQVVAVAKKMIVQIDRVLRSGQVSKEKREELKQQKKIMQRDLKVALKELDGKDK